MAPFLSSEWVLELDAIARGSRALTALAGDGPFVIEQRVTDGTGSDVRFHLVSTRSGARVLAGPASNPDLVLTVDRATAAALHRGETNAQRALAEGRLKLQGDLEALASRAAELTEVGDVFGALRTTTTEPVAGSRGAARR